MKSKMLLVKFSITLLIGMLLHGGALAEKPTYKDILDAFATISEYTMDFGMYDSNELYDLVVTNKETEYYDYIFWEYDDENKPFDSYRVYATNPNAEPLVYPVRSDKYQGNMYLFLGIVGSEDDVCPFIMLVGEGNFDKKVKSIKINAEETYDIQFKSGSETNIVDNGSLVCHSLINSYGIDIIKELSNNNLNFSMEVFFSNGKSIKIDSSPVPKKENNPFYWLYDALKVSKYIDDNNLVQMKTSELITEIEKDKNSATIKCLTKKKEVTRQPYGLRHTRVGKVGIESSVPWIQLQVENTTKDKIVDGFDLVYYGKTVYGDIIEITGDLGYLQYKTVIKDIKPKTKFTTPKIYVFGYSNIKTVCVAIRKIHFKDGTTYDVPLRDLLFINYDIEY